MGIFGFRRIFFASPPPPPHLTSSPSGTENFESPPPIKNLEKKPWLMTPSCIIVEFKRMIQRGVTQYRMIWQTWRTGQTHGFFASMLQNVNVCILDMIIQRLHIGPTLGGAEIATATEEKDFGVYQTNDCKPSLQCTKSAAKAMSSLRVIRRTANILIKKASASCTRHTSALILSIVFRHGALPSEWHQDHREDPEESN